MTSYAQFKRTLDHGAVDPSISEHVVDSQLRSAVALEPKLARYGGAILGDEVGNGKTYIAFAVLTAALLKDDTRGAVILAPTELLEKKWETQFYEYLHKAVRDRTAGARLADRIVRIDRSLHVITKGTRPKRNAIVIGRHSLFAYRVSRADQATAVAAYARCRRLQRRTLDRFLVACGLSLADIASSQSGWADQELLTKFPNLTKPIDEPFERWRKNEDPNLGPAIHEVRRLVGRRMLPNSSLVIVDEAHNLRSTSSKVYSSLMQTLDGKFDALLFLTGTPFQLGRHELRNVVEFFRCARGHAAGREKFNAAVQRMDDSMGGYVAAIDAFGRAWKALDESQCRSVVDLVQGRTPTPEDKAPSDTAGLFQTCVQAKQALETGLSPFLLRSVSEQHHHEMPGLTQASLLFPESRIPLALVDRMLYELFQEQGRTFVASVSQGACSSWEALFGSAAMAESRTQGRATRKQLVSLKAGKVLGPHPKVESTVRYCHEGLADGEKTLVFVERVATGQVLKDQLARRLADNGTQDDAKDVLQKRSRFGWPSLRENYLHTVYPLAFAHAANPRALHRLGQENKALFERADTGRGTDRDYAVEKRFWEHVYISDALEHGAPTPEGFLGEMVRGLADPQYVLNGLYPEPNESGRWTLSPRRSRSNEPRAPRIEFARAYLRYPSPWAPHARTLAEIRPAWRADFVEQAAASIGRSHLRHELAALPTDGDVGKHFRQMNRLLTDTKRGWPPRFVALVNQLAQAARDPDNPSTQDGVERLIRGLRSSERVQFIGPESKPETRDQAVKGFNTPLYPDVLISTPVLSEGIDLHHSCRRVVHHDLPWNPAKLEQRTGRIDRVGSLLERLREGDQSALLQVSLPFMLGTYDQFIFNRVMARRREFRCLLGSPPEWERDELPEDERGEPIAEELVRLLQVNLGPGTPLPRT